MKSKLKKVIIFVFRAMLRLDVFIDKFFGLACLSLINNRGKNCFIEGKGKFYKPNLISLGDEVSIGRNFFIRGGGKITIGSHSHISRNVTIHTVNHNINGSLLPYDRNDIEKDVSIGKYVWIGMNVCILPGVTIGDGAVIGMGAVITKDVKSGEVVVGSEQRVIKERNTAHTQKLIKSNSFLKNK